MIWIKQFGRKRNSERRVSRRDRTESSRSRTGELDRFSILEKTVKEWGGSVEGRGRVGQGRKEGEGWKGKRERGREEETAELAAAAADVQAVAGWGL
ncbi:hypothetical protein WR25_00913 [Diploscapter pachys]|uniref:Uncharacterized protein n=1 Tax=Diploscapter pachys TaxID=2018661 RepID=A0A2A2KVQ5_9BILA|nr:hypothetical protein WR25_00913 [Diploscapter pachys]